MSCWPATLQARHRKILLATALVVWSVATGLTGFATQFWEVAAARVLQGIGEAGCTPFATALIADYFPRNVLGTAVSFYNIGIYTGAAMPHPAARSAASVCSPPDARAAFGSQATPWH